MPRPWPGALFVLVALGGVANAQQKGFLQKLDPKSPYGAPIVETRVTPEKAATGTAARKAALQAQLGPLGVEPEPAAPEANVWRVRVLIFARTSFAWTDAKGAHRVATSLTDADMADVRASIPAFAAEVAAGTRGRLRIEAEVEVVDATVTKLSGKDSFFPYPGDLPYDWERLEQGRYASIMAVVPFGAREIPRPMLGGTYGADLGRRGAGYSGFPYYAGDMRSRNGELVLHEWLHQVDWAFEKMGVAAFPSPDEGRVTGEAGGDPDQPAHAKGASWLPFYQHMMRDHATEEQWSKVRMPATGGGFLGGVGRALEDAWRAIRDLF